MIHIELEKVKPYVTGLTDGVRCKTFVTIQYKRFGLKNRTGFAVIESDEKLLHDVEVEFGNRDNLNAISARFLDGEWDQYDECAHMVRRSQKRIKGTWSEIRIAVRDMDGNIFISTRAEKTHLDDESMTISCNFRWVNMVSATRDYKESDEIVLESAGSIDIDPYCAFCELFTQPKTETIFITMMHFKLGEDDETYLLDRLIVAPERVEMDEDDGCFDAKMTFIHNEDYWALRSKTLSFKEAANEDETIWLFFSNKEKHFVLGLDATDIQIHDAIPALSLHVNVENTQGFYVKKCWMFCDWPGTNVVAF